MKHNVIKVGLIGAGDNTRKKHIPGFKAIQGVELAGVVNRSHTSSQKVADEFNIPHVYDNWLSLTTAPDIDAICVGTWPYLHHPIVLSALENGKHVLTEARMALNTQEAREMLAAARSKPHLVTQLVPAPFTFPFEETIIKKIQEGYIGNLLSVDCDISQGFPNQGAEYMWRHDRDLSGYNAMLLGGWYECLMRFVGPASSVTAVTKTVVGARKNNLGMTLPTDIPDHVEVLCELPSGAIMRIRVTEVLGHAKNALWFYGTEGTLLVDFSTLNQYSGDTGEPILYGGRRKDLTVSPIKILPQNQKFWRVEEEFINAIRAIEPVTLNTFEIGVRYMEFTEAVTHSSDSGQKIPLPLRY